jgi:hypothetical protein
VKNIKSKYPYVETNEEDITFFLERTRRNYSVTMDCHDFFNTFFCPIKDIEFIESFSGNPFLKMILKLLAVDNPKKIEDLGLY